MNRQSIAGNFLKRPDRPRPLAALRRRRPAASRVRRRKGIRPRHRRAALFMTDWGRRPSRPISALSATGSRPSAKSPGRRGRAVIEAAGKAVCPGFHRCPRPFRFGAAGQSPGRKRRPAGRDDADQRQLRVLAVSRRRRNPGGIEVRGQIRVRSRDGLAGHRRFPRPPGKGRDWRSITPRSSATVRSAGRRWASTTGRRSRESWTG